MRNRNDIRTLVDYLIRNDIDFSVVIKSDKENKHRVKPILPLRATIR